MNPFDLRGPQFLLFYVLLMIGTWIAIALIRRVIDAEGEEAREKLTDPYLIALLREGPKEMARVAIASLLDRGLLAVTEEGVRTTDVGDAVRVRRDLERTILDHCRTPRLLSTLAEAPEILTVCASREADLQRMGHLPTGAQRVARRALLLGGGGFLLAVAAIKIVVALSRGRTNIVFLLLLMVLAVWVAAALAMPRQTSRGRRHLGELRNLFESLRLRASQLQPGGATSELAMLMAVFGATAVTVTSRNSWLTILYPKPQASAGDSSCSSSSSCGSSCSGGCGGGGCGGCGS
jgi:uncharacterized protein (TIGR04222 family)